MNESDVRTLAERGTFSGHSIHGRIEETHISWVILTKKYVFKIKKPVKFSFLDFSTLTKRKKYCIRELELNQRFSPIYLNVLPVRKNGDSWIIGDDSGKTVEYVLCMRRMVSAKRMDKLLRKRKVTADNIRSLASVVSSFHSRAEVITAPFHLSKARTSFNDIRSIISLTKQHLGNKYVQIIRKSIGWSNSFLKKHAARLRERISLGFCRDVHGDLHSGNIFLYKNPVLFDCLEFNDSYRRIDVINEIAFFCMDLEAYNETKLARLFKKEYQRHFACFQTAEDKRLMTYYKCYGANVRAKIHALTTEQAHDPESYRAHLKAWRTYLRLMRHYINQAGTL